MSRQVPQAIADLHDQVQRTSAEMRRLADLHTRLCNEPPGSAVEQAEREKQAASLLEQLEETQKKSERLLDELKAAVDRFDAGWTPRSSE